MSATNLQLTVAKARVQTPDTLVSTAYVFIREATVAVWVEDRIAKTAERVLYAEGVSVEKPTRGRSPMIITLPTGEQWQIAVKSYSGPCCSSPLKGKSADFFLDLANASL